MHICTGFFEISLKAIFLALCHARCCYVGCFTHSLEEAAFLQSHLFELALSLIIVSCTVVVSRNCKPRSQLGALHIDNCRYRSNCFKELQME